MDFIQHKLATNFGYTNDQVMESLQDCLKHLQVNKFKNNKFIFKYNSIIF